MIKNGRLLVFLYYEVGGSAIDALTMTFPFVWKSVCIYIKYELCPFLSAGDGGLKGSKIYPDFVHNRD